MTEYVLDTDTLTLLLIGHPTVTANALAHPPESLAVTIVTVEETWMGRHAKLRRARRGNEIVDAYAQLQKVVDSFRVITVLPFEAPASVRFDDLRRQHRRVGTNDLRIAAIALENGATLVTRNLGDFHAISGLRIVDWSV